MGAILRDERFGVVYGDGPGQPPLPTRLMAGLVILKHLHNLSDDVLCERWLEAAQQLNGPLGGETPK
jgi:hypothetical protein